jgi:DNA-binding NtrC family response regulator
LCQAAYASTAYNACMAHILIVEDDPNISGLYYYILKKRGHTVLQARDSDEALGDIALIRPSLIILDLLMPGDNGVEFLRKANLAVNSPETKVLVVSNVESPEFAKQLEPFHVLDYLIKTDYSPHRIADIVEKAVSRESGALRMPAWFRQLFSR